MPQQKIPMLAYEEQAWGSFRESFFFKSICLLYNLFFCVFFSSCFSVFCLSFVWFIVLDSIFEGNMKSLSFEFFGFLFAEDSLGSFGRAAFGLDGKKRGF